MPIATLSVDVDPVDLHLVGYGFAGLPPDGLAYEIALPRLAECFARHNIRATLFVVARDAVQRAEVLRATARAGHEIASHSWSHPLALASLNDAALDRELGDSRHALEQACGHDVVGFRSPNFDMSPRTLDALVRHGYRYDASGYPTPFLLPARMLLALKSKDPMGVLRLKPWPFSWRREDHTWGSGERTLAEFPVSVAGPARMPVYHTLRYALSDARFESTLDGLAKSGRGLSYVMHAVDVLGLAEDKVDARLGGHPGMDRALEAKLALLDRTLAAIAKRFTCVTYRERLDRAVHEA